MWLVASCLGLAAACSDAGDKGANQPAPAQPNKPAPSPFEPMDKALDPLKNPQNPQTPMPEGPGSRPTEKAGDFPNLKIEVTKPGTGPALEYGQKAKFHYVGTLVNGKQFDSSRDKGEPFETVLGINQVVKGWVLGLEGMKVGERRRVIVPPELAYGKVPRSSIPADSTLVFDVELMEITQPATANGAMILGASSQPSSALTPK